MLFAEKQLEFDDAELVISRLACYRRLYTVRRRHEGTEVIAVEKWVVGYITMVARQILFHIISIVS